MEFLLASSLYQFYLTVLPIYNLSPGYTLCWNFFSSARSMNSTSLSCQSMIYFLATLCVGISLCQHALTFLGEGCGSNKRAHKEDVADSLTFMQASLKEGLTQFQAGVRNRKKVQAKVGKQIHRRTLTNDSDARRITSEYNKPVSIRQISKKGKTGISMMDLCTVSLGMSKGAKYLDRSSRNLKAHTVHLR